jgi:predicted glycoside hydrolase/deacetylase ChbG (UPF0249 family)
MQRGRPLSWARPIGGSLPPGTTWLERLGSGPGARVAVIHIDDVGMCAAANAGALDALAGAATCASVMVPAPGFAEIAALARARPELDLGVHLTLNSEWDALRWAPLSPSAGSLRDPDGMLWRTPEQTVEHASETEVRAELRAQLERALDAGIDVTHLDAHMGTALDPRFARAYLELAFEFRLPAFVPDIGAVELSPRQARAAPLYLELLAEVRARGYLVFDHFEGASLRFEPGCGLAHNRARVARLGPGLSYLITHCARGDAELRGFARDWQLREEERRIYSDGSMREVLAQAGVRTLGMRALREQLRARAA